MTLPADDDVAAVAALGEPTRRRLYDYVVRAAAAVGRDEAATAVGIPRTTAAFHLDRLVDEGLLDVVRERLNNRSGPGAGRPSKLYLRSGRDVGVSLPGRRYDLAGELLAAAVEESASSGVPVRDALASRARDVGVDIGRAAREAATPTPTPGDVLEDYGYEPRVEDETLLLANCPFHSLARAHTALVCGMNLELIGGVLVGLGVTDSVARLAPREGHCCVVISQPLRSGTPPSPRE